MIPETDLTRVRRWLDARNSNRPPHVVDLIRYELDVDDRAVTILECRPPWSEGFGPEWTQFPIARLRYTMTRREWQIYWRDSNLKFHAYDLVQPSANLEALLTEIDTDPTCIFWG